MDIKKVFGREAAGYCFVWKTAVLFFAISILSLHPPIYAEVPDSLAHSIKQQEDIVVPKTGWSFVPFPALSYNSDEGVQLGLNLNAYNYGDGSMFPDPEHFFSFHFSYYTKGSNVFNILYDSKCLIPDIRLCLSASYITNMVLNFWGFNGFASPIHTELSRDFYTIERKRLHVAVNTQGRITRNLNWASGAAYYDFTINGRAEPSLYSLYVENGIIREHEKNGGRHIELSAGFDYDTRDNEYDPSRGIYIEGLLLFSPDILNRDRDFSYLRGAFSFRQFMPIGGRKLIFAYNLSYHGRIAGNMPFYMLPVYSMMQFRTINPALLGGANTIRGVNLSRIVSNGVVWANTELRWRFMRFKVFKQRTEYVLAPSFDIGRSVQPYRLAKMRASNNDLIYSGEKERLHMGVGIGLKLILNYNFVVSVDTGVPLDGRDGNFGLYFTMNYMF